MPTKSDSQYVGLILAAGRGRRMGRTKQLLPWNSPAGKKPLVAAAFDAIQPICDSMIVVVGHDATAVAAALGERSFRQVIANPDAPMFHSIRAGLAAAQSLNATATFVLHPGDHPQVAPATLAALVAAAANEPDRAVLPEFQGRGGHPVLIPPIVAAHILLDECPNGLGQFWQDHPELCHREAVDDNSILRDIDTPADLADGL
jgi:molybdenum cofactor cytidylyltransferase